MKKNQNGIALVESLLIILILVIIGFGGYYVWHTQKQTDKTNADTLKASQSTSTQNSNQNYLTIKEWGVRAAYTGSDTLTYHVADGGINGIEVISQNLKENYGCMDSGAGLIARFKSGDDIYQTTVDQDAASNPNDYGHVGDYYYHFSHDQSACSDEIANTNDKDGAQSAANNLTHSIVPKLKATPQ